MKNSYLYKWVVVFLMLILGMNVSVARSTISGQTIVNEGDTYTYTYNDGEGHGITPWTVQNGTEISSSIVGTNYSITITWGAPTGGSITFRRNEGYFENRNVGKLVLINEAVVPAPRITDITISDNDCGNKTISWDHPAGVESTYWQGTNENGTATGDPNNTSRTVGTGTYYLRSYNPNFNKWSAATAVEVEVFNLTSGGSVIDNNETICRGTTPSPIISNAPGTSTDPSVTLEYQWYKKPAGLYWNDIPGATSVSYTPTGAHYTDTQYKRIVKYGNCDSLESNIVTITVLDEMEVSINYLREDPICAVNEFDLLVKGTVNGGSGDYTYLWKKLIEGLEWATIPNSDVIDITTGNLTKTTSFQLFVTDNVCGTEIPSNIITQVVYDTLEGGTVNSNQTICYNTRPAMISTQSFAKGGSDSFTYKWQYENGIGSGDWKDINPAVTTYSYHPPVLTTDQNYRRKATDASCGETFSNEVFIDVVRMTSAGVIADSQEFCGSQVPAPFTSTSLPTLVNGTAPVSYQWYHRSGSADWAPITGATAATYAVTDPISDTTYYKRDATMLNCTPMSSNEIVVNVTPLVEVEIRSIVNSPICQGSGIVIGGFLTEGSGDFSYQWQISSDSTNWADIEGATEDSYQAESISEKTYFRLLITDNVCGNTTISNVFSQDVYDLFEPGTIGSAQTICYDATPTTILNLGPATGGSGNITYQWEFEQGIGSNDWQELEGKTGLNYSPSNLTSTQNYRRKAVDQQCGVTYSNEVLITVLDPLNPGTIKANKTIKTDTDAGTLVSDVLPSGGDGSYVYQWQSSSNGVDFTDMSGKTTENLVLGNLGVTTYYQRLISSCGQTDSSNIVKVLVVDFDLTVTPNYRCGYGAVTLSASGAVEGLHYQWYDNDVAIEGATGAEFTTPGLTSTKTYQVAIVNEEGMEYFMKDVVATINFTERPKRPILLSGCTTSADTLQRDTTDINPDYTYYWQNSPITRDDTNSDEFYIPTVTGQYYLRAQHNTTLCWSEASVGQVVVVNNESAPDNPNKPNGTTAPDAATAGTYQTFVDQGNYVRSYTTLQEGVTEEILNIGIDPAKASVNTAYVDGLGRTVQSVTKGGSPNGNDIVQAMEYDELGRQVKSYLPYAASSTDGSFQTNALSDQYAFYADDNNKIATTGKAYTEAVFENSPMDRVVANFAQGESWVGTKGTENEKKKSYTARSNYAIEVIKWELSSEGLPEIRDVQIPFYDAQTLYVHEFTDEDNNTSIEYKNKDGQVVLVKMVSENNDVEVSYTETYSIYDDHSNLRYVLQPQFLEEYNFEMDDSEIKDLLDKYAFQYQYDERNRQISKKIPGSGLTEMVYDKLDRLVLSQNAIQATQGKWEFSKYDIFNRPVLTGMYYSENFNDRAYYQNILDNQTVMSIDPSITNEGTNGPILLEGYTLQGDDLILEKYEGHTTYLATSTIDLLPGWDMNAIEEEKTLDSRIDVLDITKGAWVQGYFDETFPHIENAEILTVNYYDDYDFNADGKNDYEYITSYDHLFTSPAVAPQVFNRTQGKLTGTKVRNLETMQWLSSARYYDQRGRVIQVQSENHKGGNDIFTYAYDFSNKQLQSVVDHITEFENKQVIKKFLYDNSGRLTSTIQKIDSQKEEILSELEYNEIGELTQKKQGGGLQNIDYQYNIRGWMTGVNDINIPNTETDDLFSMAISYEHGFDDTIYGGNISGVRWKSGIDYIERAYGYEYDKLGRIKRADYVAKNESNVWEAEANQYSVFDINYDDNGNILSMARQGLVSYGQDDINTFGAIDRMLYTYEGNQLIAVDDKVNTKTMAKDFLDKGSYYCDSNINEYTYDEHGNLLSEDNKEIANISYNYMNLVERIYYEDGKTIRFVYTSDGRKLQKIDKMAGEYSTPEITDFVGSFMYMNDKLQSITGTEGADVLDTDGTFKHNYYISDHLDNPRVTFAGGLHTATMDTENASEEADEFYGLLESQVIGEEVAFKGDGASLLPAIEGGETTFGPQKRIRVQPNDVIYVSAFGAYYDGSTPSYTLGTQTGGGANSGIGEGGVGSITSGVTATNNGGSSDGNSPEAYLNLMFLPLDNSQPQEFKMYLNGDANAYHELKGELSIDRQGYVLIYVANESDTDVFFDEITIKHLHIESESQTYPFGMQLKGLQPFSSADLLDGDKLKWHDLGFRHFDYQLGRFHATDPLGEIAVKNSTYHYAGNNPISKIDVLGLTEDKPKKTPGKIKSVYTLGIFVTNSLTGQVYMPDIVITPDDDTDYDKNTSASATSEAGSSSGQGQSVPSAPGSSKKSKGKGGSSSTSSSNTSKSKSSSHEFPTFDLNQKVLNGPKKDPVKEPKRERLEALSNSDFNEVINIWDSRSANDATRYRGNPNALVQQKAFEENNKELYQMTPTERIQQTKLSLYTGIRIGYDNSWKYVKGGLRFAINLGKATYNYLPLKVMSELIYDATKRIVNGEDPNKVINDLYEFNKEFLKSFGETIYEEIKGLLEMVGALVNIIYEEALFDLNQTKDIIECVLTSECNYDINKQSPLEKLLSKIGESDLPGAIGEMMSKIDDFVAKMANEKPDPKTMGTAYATILTMIFGPEDLAIKAFAKVSKALKAAKYLDETGEIMATIKKGGKDVDVPLGKMEGDVFVPEKLPDDFELGKVHGEAIELPTKNGDGVEKLVLVEAKDGTTYLTNKYNDVLKKMDEAGIDDSLKKDPDFLEKMAKYNCN